MAHIGKLTEAVAEALQFPLPTVRKFARVLREEELISKKGHGRGADHATPLDAARLIIALMVTARPAEAGEVVRDFGALVMGHAQEMRITRGDRVTGATFTLAAACGLPKRHAFDAAVAAIISGFSDDRFISAFLSEAHQLVTELPFVSLPRVEVGVLDTALAAGIQIGSNSYKYNFGAFVDCPVGEPLDKAARQFERVARKYKRGIESRRTVDLDVLRKIALVVNGAEIDIEGLLAQRVRKDRQ
jgi:hypothetical protein